ncbi:MAG: hypothetical protein QG670_1433 [Thermoproteota archaeon]|nr:hypothetical protein [Thermoproteota archaeon]
MKSGEIIGKMVLSSEGLFVGGISEIEFDRNTWNVADICVDLEKKIIETMGFKKPMIGGIKAHIPVTAIRGVGDVVSLKKSTVELRNIARRI